jgi:hypothetical protein
MLFRYFCPQTCLKTQVVWSYKDWQVEGLTILSDLPCEHPGIKGIWLKSLSLQVRKEAQRTSHFKSGVQYCKFCSVPWYSQRSLDFLITFFDFDEWPMNGTAASCLARLHSAVACAATFELLTCVSVWTIAVSCQWPAKDWKSLLAYLGAGSTVQIA